MAKIAMLSMHVITKQVVRGVLVVYNVFLDILFVVFNAHTPTLLKVRALCSFFKSKSMKIYQ